MMAKSSKKSAAKPSRSSSKRAAPAKAAKSVKQKEKPMPFYKLLTAEGWRRLMTKKKSK